MTINPSFQNAAEFEAWYAANSRVAVEDLHLYGHYGAPCDCGDPSCTGWQMEYRTVGPLAELEKAITRPDPEEA